MIPGLESAFPSRWHSQTAPAQSSITSSECTRPHTGRSAKAGCGGRNFPLSNSWFLTRVGVRTSPLVQVSILCRADFQRRYHRTYKAVRSHRHWPKRRGGRVETGRSGDREDISSSDGKSVLKFFHGTFPS